MKRLSTLMLVMLVVLTASAQRISGLEIEGVTALTKFGAFNPGNNNASKPGDGQIVVMPGTDLSNVNVTFNVGTDASVVEPNPLPTDWSSTVSGIKVEKDDGTTWALYDITIKPIVPTTLPFEIITGNDGNFDSNSWTHETVGWAGVAIDKGHTNIRFGGPNRSFVIAFTDTPEFLYYTLKFLATETPDGVVFDVDASADGVEWNSIQQYNDDNRMPGSSPAVEMEIELDPDVRFLRWTYTTRPSGNVALENVFISKGVGTSVKDIIPRELKPFYSNNKLNFRSTDEISTLSVFDLTGRVRFETSNVQAQNDISALQSGIYVTKVTLKNGTTFATKFVK